MSFINTDSRFVQPNEKPKKENTDLVNELIRFPEVLLIDDKGQQLGVKSRDEALRIAELKNLDLLCVAPMAKPPVCKIINYGKYKFEQQKKLKEMKKNQKVVETKEYFYLFLNEAVAFPVFKGIYLNREEYVEFIKSKGIKVKEYVK